MLYDFKCTICGNVRKDIDVRSDVKAYYLPCTKDKPTTCLHARMIPAVTTNFREADRSAIKRKR